MVASPPVAVTTTTVPPDSVLIVVSRTVPPALRLMLPAALIQVCGGREKVLGAMQALEVVKEITGAGESLAGRLILFDALSMRFETIRYSRGRD